MGLGGKCVQQAIKTGISLIIEGGTATSSITLTVTNGDLKFELGEGTGDNFKAMWHDIEGGIMPEAQSDCSLYDL